MISPIEAGNRIRRAGVPYGHNVNLNDDVDTSQCEEFFGTRCPGNVHVTGRETAHVDRVDPRRNPIAHLRKDVGIPYSVTSAASFAVLGALSSPDNRVSGAIEGGIFGFILGLAADVLSG
jgi:hypothetical protein